MSKYNKREYNSERRRKHFFSSLVVSNFFRIRENITPRGDGNLDFFQFLSMFPHLIRENITPRGDGNIYKFFNSIAINSSIIRENITPRGDGNFLTVLVLLNRLHLYKREYNSERRRKLFTIVQIYKIISLHKREYNSERRRKLC